MILAKTNE